MENHRVANGVSSGGPPNGMSPLSLIAVNGILTPSPTPSPDELVIRSRGRRQAPETWSPIAVRQAKTIPTPKKGSGTRMSPRKHLLLTDCKEHELTSTNAISAFAARMALLNGAKKKAKVSHHQESIPSTSIRSAAKALSHQQLVELLTTLITIHPELKP
ncbi:unnamed protein product [Darwinula stevensoni]|uniref:Uncharacterized protein n=1 Tax=Darwinula stevensoni TaxID=69355 RepID=A0A7R9A5S9_9CRUS|nr:unnamed protein product [Darwinula stevensoni]CAG0895019.1 unnamed protein product [Darwinula stevensoni]